MKKCFFNGMLILPDKLLCGYAMIVQDGIIQKICPELEVRSAGRANPENRGIPDMEYIDLRGRYVLPGFIDIHSDYIEGIIQPRPSSMMDFESSIYEAERHLISHGITTIYHSLSLVKEKYDFERLSVRNRENVDRLVKILKVFDHQAHLIHNRFHARYELDNPELFEYLEGLLKEGYVQELSFMDHTPGQGQYRDLEIYTDSLKQWKGIKSDEEFERFIEESRNKPMVTHEMLLKLAGLAADMGIPLASHDDDSTGKLDFIEKEYKVNISEFPITMEVAKKAHDDGLWVVAGAPNVMLGGSHAGNLNAEEAIRAGHVDILCSDYYPPAMLQAVFRLWKNGAVKLFDAVKMVSLNPAKAVKIDEEYGSLEEGKRADILVVNVIEGHPSVERCYVDGEMVLQFQYDRRKGVAC